MLLQGPVHINKKLLSNARGPVHIFKKLHSNARGPVNKNKEAAQCFSGVLRTLSTRSWVLLISIRSYLIKSLNKKLLSCSETCSY